MKLKFGGSSLNTKPGGAKSSTDIPTLEIVELTEHVEFRGNLSFATPAATDVVEVDEPQVSVTSEGRLKSATAHR